MAKTYSAIQTYTMTGTTASVTFSNIPQNFTDLKVVLSTRTTGSYVGSPAGYALGYQFNGSTSGYTAKEYMGYGTSSKAADNSTTISTNGATWGRMGDASSIYSNATTYTFANTDLYIPGYSTSGIAKPAYTEAAIQSNDTSYSEITFAELMWTGTDPITSIAFTPSGSASFVTGSTFTLYGIGTGAKATGGTVVGSGNYIYHTFLSTGSFIPTEQIKNAEVLVIGGGGGAASYAGGGGGAGGLLGFKYQSLTAGTIYTCTVGSGGASSGVDVGTNIYGSNGNNSQFGSLTAAIGGGGGGGGSGSGTSPGRSGGSGGGGGGRSTSATGGAGTSGQGYAGGGNDPVNAYYGGGGGGAGGVGTTGNQSVVRGNVGGVGSATFTDWGYATNTGQNVGSVFYYAGGGGGYGDAPGAAGGYGGGGGGYVFAAGLVNTGGGGGTCTNLSGAAAFGAGGSGIVIVRYPVN